MGSRRSHHQCPHVYCCYCSNQLAPGSVAGRQKTNTANGPGGDDCATGEAPAVTARNRRRSHRFSAVGMLQAQLPTLPTNKIRRSRHAPLQVWDAAAGDVPSDIGRLGDATDGPAVMPDYCRLSDDESTAAGSASESGSESDGGGGNPSSGRRSADGGRHRTGPYVGTGTGRAVKAAVKGRRHSDVGLRHGSLIMSRKGRGIGGAATGRQAITSRGAATARKMVSPRRKGTAPKNGTARGSAPTPSGATAARQVRCCTGFRAW